MYGIAPDRFADELRRIARSICRWDQRISGKLELLADRLHEPDGPCDCQICRDRFHAEHPIRSRHMTADEASAYYLARRQD